MHSDDCEETDIKQLKCQFEHELYVYIMTLFLGRWTAFVERMYVKEDSVVSRGFAVRLRQRTVYEYSISSYLMLDDGYHEVTYHTLSHVGNYSRISPAGCVT